MALGQITRTLNFLAPKHAISIQPVRTWRNRFGNVGSLTVKYETKPVVDPPAGTERFVYNRNPRNLERLAIAYRHRGWTIDKQNRTYYHKILVKESRAGVQVACVHQNGYVAVSVSSEEWSIRKFLVRAKDRSAYINVGKIFARRCLQSGLNEMCNFYQPTEGGKLALLLEEVEKGGVTFEEPPQHYLMNPMTKQKPLRPWDIVIE